MSAANDESELRDRLLGALQPLPQERLSLVYRAALALTAVVMLLLPLLYLALIAAVGYWIYWFAVHGGNMNGRAYVMLILAGVVAVLFLVKPIFAPRVQRGSQVVLEPGDEPLLFAFVGRLCDVVAAPHPTQIAVDQQVNASAGFRRGVASMFSNDLVLTIGLPLVRGLTLNQLAGVLAHEFGHFSQGAGMRISYLIRSINFWFLRVVHERDAWDEALARGSASWSWGDLISIGEIMVWLTRRVLAVLAWTGNVISSFFMRQMELDADSYQARLVGAQVFTEEAHEERLLGLADQLVRQELSEAWREGRLANNLPAMVQHARTNLQPELTEALDRYALAAKTGWFDTHPSDAARIQSVQRWPVGSFAVDLPATALFRDFDRLAERVTVHHYREDLELDVTPEALVSADEILALTRSRRAQRSALHSILGTIPTIFFPVPVSTETSGDEQTQLSVDEIPAEAEPFAKCQRRCAELHVQVINAMAADAALRAGIKIDKDDYGLTSAKPVNVVAALEQRSAEEQRLLSQTAEPSERMARALAGLIAARTEPTNRPAVQSHLWLLGRLGEGAEALRRLDRAVVVMQILLQNRKLAAKTAPVDELLTEWQAVVQQELEQLRALWSQAAPEDVEIVHGPDSALPTEAIEIPIEVVTAGSTCLQEANELYLRHWGELFEALGLVTDQARGSEPAPED